MVGRVRAGVLAVLVVGCGRIGFDDLADSSVEPDPWYTSGGDSWGFRKRITIDGSRLTDDLVDFPVLVSLVEADLGSLASGGRVATGYDILFTDDDGVTRLEHETEHYDPTGELIAWVRLPHLTASVDRDFYLYFGNAGVTASQEVAAAVWDASYAAVWHLREDPSGAPPQWRDSTTGAHHCTASGNVTSGNLSPARIGGGSRWDPLDTNTANCGAASALDNVFTGGGTISAWIRPLGWGRGTYGRIADKSFDDQAVSGGYGLQVNENFGTGRSVEFDHGFSGSRGSWTTSLDSIALDTWHHVAVVYDDSSETNDPAIYINGVANPVSEQVTPAGVAIDDDPALFMFGNSNSTLRTFDGLIDEVRVSRVMRSAGWITTSHANQSSPSTFYSVGSLEAR